MASGPIASWEIGGETVETVSDFISGVPTSAVYFSLCIGSVLRQIFFFPLHGDKMAASTSQLPSGPLKQVHGKREEFPTQSPRTESH